MITPKANEIIKGKWYSKCGIWILVLWLLPLKLITLQAQTNFKPGFIITNAGDTLKGSIDYRGNKLMTSQCKFKDSQKNVTLYLPGDIAEYRFTDGKYFVSKRWNDQMVFMEYLVKGQVNLYTLHEYGTDHYFVDREGEGLAEIKYDEGIKQHEDKSFYYESTRHMGVLKYYMKDAPQIEPEIEALKKPDLTNLLDISESYHAQVCPNETCVLYKKRLPSVGLSLEPFVGFNQYKGFDGVVNEYGANFYLWAPRLNEKIYFKTGFTFQKQPTTDETVTTFKVPFQLQYLYNAYRLQPKISGGVNLFIRELEDYTDLYSSLSLNLGLNYELAETIALSAWFNTDYTSVSQTFLQSGVGAGLISYSFSLGVLISL